jgi:autotransporter translocation and assembly factor TamB
MSRGRRFARGLLRFLLWLLPGAVAAGVLLGGLAWLWLRTEAGNDWLLARLLPEVQPAAGRIEVAQLRTDLWSEVRLEGVALVDPDERRVLAAEVIDAEVAMQSLVGRVVPIRRLRIVGLDAQLSDPEVFRRMWPADPEAPARPWSGLPVDVLVDQLEVLARVRVGDRTFESVGLSGGLTARGRQVSWRNLSLIAATPAGPLYLTGAGAWSPDRTVLEPTVLGVGPGGAAGVLRFNRVELHGALVGEVLALDLDAVQLDLPALLPLLPGLAGAPVIEPFEATGHVGGTVTEPAVTLDLDTPGGRIAVTASAVPATRAWSLGVVTPGFDGARVLPDLPPFSVSGALNATGAGTTWPDDLRLDGDLDATLTLRGETMAAKGPLHLEGGVLRLDHLDATGFDARAQVSGSVDVPERRADLTVHRARGGLGRVGAKGQASFAGDLGLTWGERVTAEVFGVVEATEVEWRGLEVGRADGEVQALWDGTAARGHAALDATSLRFGDRRAATARVTVDVGERITFSTRLAEPDREVGLAEGSFGPEDRRLHLERLRLELAPALVLEAEGPQTVRLLDDGVADSAVHLRLGAADVRVTGGINARARDALVVSLASLDLHDLDAALPGRLPGWQGRVDGHLGLVGTLVHPTWEGDLHVEDLAIPEQIAGVRAALAFEGGDAGARITGELGSAKGDLVDLAATLPIRLSREGVRWRGEDTLAAAVRLRPAETAEIAALLAGRSLPPGRLSAELRVAGSLAAPRLGLTASVDVPLAEDGPTARTWVEAALEDGVARVRVVLNQSFQARLEGTLAARVDTAPITGWLTRGAARPALAPLVTDFGGAVVLKQLPLATIRRVAPFEGDVDGALAGAFAVSGTVLAPRLQGGVNVVDARVGSLEVQPATFELTPLPLGYRIAARLGFRTRVEAADPAADALPTCARSPGDPAGAIEVAGFVPLDERFDTDRPGLTLTVSGAGVPLAAGEAFVPAVTDTGGCLTVGGAVTGTVRRPEFALGVALQKGASTVLPLGVRLEDIDLDGRFQAGRLVVDQFSARTDAGRPRLDQATSGLQGKGEVLVENGVPTEASGTLTLDHAWLIARADRLAQVTGQLELRARKAIVDVNGALTVDEAWFNFPSRFFADSGEGGLHPDVHVVRPGGEVAAVERGERLGWGLTVRPKVHVDLARHTKISASLPLQGAYGDLARSLSTVRVDTELDGEVDLTWKAGNLRLTGELETTRGTAGVLGRPFDLTGGSLGFTGADVTRPILDLRADHTVSCSGEPANVHVAITGVPGAPELKFSGDGALADQDAIVRALVLGSCPGDDAADAAGQDALLSLVATMLADDLAASGRTLFQLESLELDTSGSTRVGVALGKDIFLTTGYDPLADPLSENRFSVQLELALPYRWYLSVETGDRGVTTVSSYRKFRF